MGSFGGLATKLNKLANNLEKTTDARVRRVALAVVTDLVAITPVDTGKAMSNWQISLGQPIASSIGIKPFASGFKGSTRRANFSQAVAAAQTALQYRNPGQAIYISNVTPYIEQLDQGSSNQFGGNFAARARIVARNTT